MSPTAGFAAIHLAVQFGHSPLVGYLVAKGTPVDARDAAGTITITIVFANISTIIRINSQA